MPKVQFTLDPMPDEKFDPWDASGDGELDLEERQVEEIPEVGQHILVRGAPYRVTRLLTLMSYGLKVGNSYHLPTKRVYVTPVPATPATAP